MPILLCQIFWATLYVWLQLLVKLTVNSYNIARTRDGSSRSVLVLEDTSSTKRRDLGLGFDALSSRVWPSSPLKRARSSLFAYYSRRCTAARTSCRVLQSDLPCWSTWNWQRSRCCCQRPSVIHGCIWRLRLWSRYCSCTSGKSYVSSGNFAASGAHLQSEWLDHAPQPCKLGKKLLLVSQLVFLQESRAVARKPPDAAAVFSVKVRRQHSLQV